MLTVPLSGLRQSPLNGKSSPKQQDTMAVAERKHIVTMLDQTNWVLAGPQETAARLGMKRSTLQYRMDKLEISRATRSARNPLVSYGEQ